MCYGLPKFDKSKILSVRGQISNFDVTFYIQSVFDQLNHACSNIKIIQKLVKIEDEDQFSYRSQYSNNDFKFNFLKPGISWNLWDTVPVL